MQTRNAVLAFVAIVLSSAPATAFAGLKCSAFRNTIEPAYQSQYDELLKSQQRDRALVTNAEESAEAIAYAFQLFGRNLAYELAKSGLTSKVNGYYFRKDLLPRNQVTTELSAEEQKLQRTEGHALARELERASVDTQMMLLRRRGDWEQSSRAPGSDAERESNGGHDAIPGIRNTLTLNHKGRKYGPGALFISLAPGGLGTRNGEPDPTIKLVGSVPLKGLRQRIHVDLDFDLLTGTVKVTKIHGGSYGDLSALKSAEKAPTYPEFRDARLKKDGLVDAFKFCENLETDRRAPEMAHTGQNKSVEVPLHPSAGRMIEVGSGGADL